MRESDEWNQLRERLRHVVRMRGADRVADEIPVDRRTVFRLLSGETRRPCLAIRVGIERVVDARSEREAEWDEARGIRRS